MNTISAKSGRLPAWSGSLVVLAALGVQISLQAQPDPNWLAHDRNRPQPPVVDPGIPSTPQEAGTAPSDAVVLFDGGDLSAWVSMNGSPTKWVARNDYMECVRGSGYIRTLQNFGDCQLHLEWATPFEVEGSGQGRGNSGVFFGNGRYEIQVLDSHNNKTYPDGSAGGVYGQYPPLVNASRPPGEWQTYDIIYTAPHFDAQKKLESPARLTVFHNGVLIQNNVELTGPTSWLQRDPYSPHPEKTPIALQDHGNPVRFRNIWVRELGKPSRKEFSLPDALLNTYVGEYELNRDSKLTITKEDGQLVARFGGARFVLFAESPTHFFAKTTDVQFDFAKNSEGQVEGVTVSVGEGGMKAKKVK